MIGKVFQYNGNDTFVSTATNTEVMISCVTDSYYCVQEDNIMLLGFTRCRPTAKQFNNVINASRFISDMAPEQYKTFYQDSLVAIHGGGTEDRYYVATTTSNPSLSNYERLGAMGVRIKRHD